MADQWAGPIDWLSISRLTGHLGRPNLYHFILYNEDDTIDNPILTGISPTRAKVGDEVTISGDKFDIALPYKGNNIPRVEFGGVEATEVFLDSGNQLRAVVPAGAQAGPIRVYTMAGHGDSPINFTPSSLQLVFILLATW